MGDLIDHHKAVADPFGLAHSAPQLGLMMGLTRGFVFPWLAGGVHGIDLVRWVIGDEVEEVNIAPPS